MELELIKKFNRSFWIILVILALAFCASAVVMVILWVNYINNKSLIIFSIIFTLFFVIYTIVAIIRFMPYVKDLKLVKEKRFEQVIGFVIRYRKIIHGGEPDTISYKPIVKNLENGEEIELDIENTQINIEYTFLYLKHTKLATAKEKQ